MNIPSLTIPNIPLPFDLPHMVHPFFVHFAIVLPIVVLILELINLFVKKRTIGLLSFFFMVLVSIVFLAAYLTGSTDAKAAQDLLSPEAKDMLLAHKQLGIYLVYASIVLMLFKLFSVFIKKVIFRILFFLVLIIFIVGIFTEGKKGGELVYQYGINVKSIPAISTKIVKKIELPVSKLAKSVKPPVETVSTEANNSTPIEIEQNKSESNNSLN